MSAIGLAKSKIQISYVLKENKLIIKLRIPYEIINIHKARNDVATKVTFIKISFIAIKN
ncbi:MAG: hypothetical protein ACFFBY_05915 [Promethearchaeota archaeon]